MSNGRNYVRNLVIVLAVSFGVLLAWDTAIGYNGATVIVTLYAIVGLAAATAYWARKGTYSEGIPQGPEPTASSPLASLALTVNNALEGDGEARYEISYMLKQLARSRGASDEDIRKLVETEPSLNVSQPAAASPIIRLERRGKDSKRYAVSLRSTIRRIENIR